MLHKHYTNAFNTLIYSNLNMLHTWVTKKGVFQLNNSFF